MKQRAQSTMKCCYVYLFVLLLMPFLGLVGSPALDPPEIHRETIVLRQGDLSPIYDAYQRKDLETLWRVFFRSAVNWYIRDYQSGRARADGGSISDGQWRELNLRIKFYSGRLLAQVPGHAVFLGNKIDNLTDRPPFINAPDISPENARDYFLPLRMLGSVECIQQIGRFLFDQRNRLSAAEVAKSFPLSEYEECLALGGVGDLVVSPNTILASEALGWIFNGREFGDNLLFENLPYPESNLVELHGLFGIRVAQRWWLADASKEYRKPLREKDAPPEPPPAKIDLQSLVTSPAPVPKPTRAQLENALLLAGDLSPVHKAYERRDLDMLWCLYDQATRISDFNPPAYADGAERVTNETQRRALDRIIKDYAGRLLTQIPGHAVFLGNRIEFLSGAVRPRSIKKNVGPKEIYFNRLMALRSTECIQQIARFIDDPRGEVPPDDPLWSSEKDKAEILLQGSFATYYSFPQKNSWRAIHALKQALAEVIPLDYLLSNDKDQERIRTGRGKRNVADYPDGRRAVSEWWLSAASKSYREPISLKEPPIEPPPIQIDVKILGH
jgi:hypothetical protein